MIEGVGLAYTANFFVNLILFSSLIVDTSDKNLYNMQEGCGSEEPIFGVVFSLFLFNTS